MRHDVRNSPTKLGDRRVGELVLRQVQNGEFRKVLHNCQEVGRRYTTHVEHAKLTQLADVQLAEVGGVLRPCQTVEVLLVEVTPAQTEILQRPLQSLQHLSETADHVVEAQVESNEVLEAVKGLPDLFPPRRPTPGLAFLEINIAVLKVKGTEAGKFLEVGGDNEEHVLLQLA